MHTVPPGNSVILATVLVIESACIIAIKDHA